MENSNKAYDFYYSEESASRQKTGDLVGYWSTGEALYKKSFAYFKGHLFTERIEHGKPPVTRFDDLRLLGTGNDDDVSWKGWPNDTRASDVCVLMGITAV